ncbi:MAG: recombinase family protein [Epulopiscium sp.]|nr:recombinase family protein [Candidatus Epulonipiscium sp.]
MKIAIYSRKSKFTGKGESVDNQIELCKEYIEKHFDNIKEFIIYEDEGFSGGDTDRPQFQQMMKNAKKKNFDILVCYRLDRISRNIADFSILIEELLNYNIAFVSIREQFDTSTPMGRAMMYIASVFAQLERETIAERIRDNMLQLAKTGRWLGGTTPTGFESKEVIYTDPGGKEKKMFKLTPVPEELDIVRLIYFKFLELKSLTKLETYCIQNNIKTRNGIDFSRFSLKMILNNPVYVTADKTLYDYFIENDYEIYASKSDFNGFNGIMAYNKTIQGKNGSIKIRDHEEWIVAVGAHQGTIYSHDWIKVQKIINRNKSKTFRQVRSSASILSGLLHCSNCGSYMRPKNGRMKKDGTRAFYYLCEMKEKSKKVKCDMRNTNGNDLDRLVIEKIKKLSATRSKLYGQINKDKVQIREAQNSLVSKISLLEANIKTNEQSIANLVHTLSQGQNTNASKYIIGQINALDEQITAEKKKLSELKEKLDTTQAKDNSLDFMQDLLTSFANTIDSLDIPGQRALLKAIVERITWDGEKAHVTIFGDNSKKIFENVSSM